VGHECLERKDYLTAIELYTMAVNGGGVEPLVWKELGDGYNGVANYYEASKAYENAVNGGLTDSKLLMELGRVHCATGEYGKAIMSYQSALNLDPDDPYLLMQIGDAYMSNKQYKQAIQNYRKGLKKSSNNAMLYDKLSRAHYAKGDHEKALKMNPNLKPDSFQQHPPSPATTPKPRVSPREFVVLSGSSTRPLPGSLRVDTQIPTLFVSTGDIGSAAGSSAEVSPRLNRKPHVRRIKSAAPAFGEWGPLSVSPPTPAAISDTIDVTTFHVSIRARQQHSSRLNDIVDTHSDRMITIGSKIAALESYSARHFDEMSVSYGDVVEVEEIYEDGWILGLKLKSSKVWEESENISEFGETAGLLEIYLETDSSKLGLDTTVSQSQSYLFELCHFCHSDEWEEVQRRGEPTEFSD
jgi:tetratricopeptide (TPR) repeat protein